MLVEGRMRQKKFVLVFPLTYLIICLHYPWSHHFDLSNLLLHAQKIFIFLKNRFGDFSQRVKKFSAQLKDESYENPLECGGIKLSTTKENFTRPLYLMTLLNTTQLKKIFKKETSIEKGYLILWNDVSVSPQDLHCKGYHKGSREPLERGIFSERASVSSYLEYGSLLCDLVEGW